VTISLQGSTSHPVALCAFVPVSRCRARYFFWGCQWNRPFLWLVLSLIGLSCRPDNVGITSFVRFLHFFRSEGINLDRLTTLWVALCLRLFQPFETGGRLVFLADGIKTPKEGKKMPAVKSLLQGQMAETVPFRPKRRTLVRTTRWNAVR